MMTSGGPILSRSHNGSNIGSGIEEPGSEGPHLPGKPFSHSLDTGRKIARFAKTQQSSHHSKLKRRSGRRVPNCRDTPNGDEDGEPSKRSNPVNDKAG